MRRMAHALVDALEARFAPVHAVVNGRLARWIQESELDLHEARVLFALAGNDRPMTPAEIAEASDVDVDSAYRAIHALHGRGITREIDRHHELTDAGRELMASCAQARREGIEAYVARLNDDQLRDLQSELRVAG
jgi:DNA-binding MarR family transcriptional regulator